MADNKKITLYDYQNNYFKYVKRNFVYDMDTGTGKTIMGLHHYNTYYNDKNLVIVAPASKINEGRLAKNNTRSLSKYKV